MTYYVATFGPIEVGRVTILKQPIPYYATVNAVGSAPNSPQLPEATFRKAFSNFEHAKHFVISFFPERTRPFIQWNWY